MMSSGTFIFPTGEIPSGREIPTLPGLIFVNPAACRFCIFQKNTMSRFIFDQRKSPPIFGQPGVFFNEQLRTHPQHGGNGINFPVSYMNMTGPSAAIPAPAALKPGHYWKSAKVRSSFLKSRKKNPSRKSKPSIGCKATSPLIRKPREPPNCQ